MLPTSCSLIGALANQKLHHDLLKATSIVPVRQLDNNTGPLVHYSHAHIDRLYRKSIFSRVTSRDQMLAQCGHADIEPRHREQWQIHCWCRQTPGRTVSGMRCQTLDHWHQSRNKCGTAETRDRAGSPPTGIYIVATDNSYQRLRPNRRHQMLPTIVS